MPAFPPRPGNSVGESGLNNRIPCTCQLEAVLLSCTLNSCLGVWCFLRTLTLARSKRLVDIQLVFRAVLSENNNSTFPPFKQISKMKASREPPLITAYILLPVQLNLICISVWQLLHFQLRQFTHFYCRPRSLRSIARIYWDHQATTEDELCRVQCARNTFRGLAKSIVGQLLNKSLCFWLRVSCLPTSEWMPKTCGLSLGSEANRWGSKSPSLAQML